MKIALVKQDVYQDLYVCGTSEKNPAKVLFSSNMRVGPIGLIAELGADFYILEEEKDPETQIYKKDLRPKLVQQVKLLKKVPLNKIPGLENLKPGSNEPQGKYAVNCYKIDWGQYDIVISLNVSLPTKLVKKYPDTLFGYMIGEANFAIHYVRFGYDVTFNQMARGIIAKKLGPVDFPYTFMSSTTLEKIMFEALGVPSKSKGIFAEINTTKERPVKNVPEVFQPLHTKGYSINLHKELIKDNLEQVYHSRYFVKVGGRRIRGNSVIEAISCGTLVLMNSKDVRHHELIPTKCQVTTIEEVEHLIQQLDNDEELYQKLLKKERDLVDKYVFEAPITSLKNCLAAKKKKSLFNDKMTFMGFLHLIDDVIKGKYRIFG